MKIICIGRNYLKHVLELGNKVPSKPLIFMKPPSALLVNDKAFYHPEFSKNIHYEAEIVLKIAKNGRHVQPEFARSYVKEVTIGIDFTARDLQEECKSKGHPWEIAKGFDGSAPVGKFIPIEEALIDGAIPFKLLKNREIVQEGDTSDLIFDFTKLICYISQFFKLQVGDLIFTGTPAGVGPVAIGDSLEGFIGERSLLRCHIK